MRSDRHVITSYTSRRLILGAALSLWMLIAAGCATRMGDFSIISTGTPQYGNMSNARIQQGCEGSDSRLWFLFIPLSSAASLDEAVDNCMDEGRGDYIERARLYKTSWSCLLFSGSGYRVVGDVGNSKSGSASTAASGSRQLNGTPGVQLNVHTGQQNANTTTVPSGPVITGPNNNNNNAGSANNSSNGGGNGNGGNRR